MTDNLTWCLERVQDVSLTARLYPIKILRNVTTEFLLIGYPLEILSQNLYQLETKFPENLPSREYQPHRKYSYE